MKVKMLTCLVGQDYVVNAKQLHECDPDEAVRLINNGLAVLEDPLPDSHSGLLGPAEVAPGAESQNVPPPDETDEDEDEDEAGGHEAGGAASREKSVSRGAKGRKTR